MGDMLSRFGHFIRTHVGGTIIVACAILFALASTAVQLWVRYGPGTIAPSPKEVAEGELPDQVTRIRKDYDKTTTDALRLLCANTWVNAEGTVLVDVTDTCLRTRTEGSDDWEAYVVQVAEKRNVEGEAVTTMCVRTKDWWGIATLEEHAQEVPGQPAPSPTLRCAQLAAGQDLTIAPELRSLTLDGPSERLLKSWGTDTETLRRELALWCAAWRPTATEAVWDHVSERDHGKESVRLQFSLDDLRSTTVTATVYADTGEIEVKEGMR